MSEVKYGDRVRLRQSNRWLSKYAPLAVSGRLGTVVWFPGDGSAEVVFDVVRPGAKAIEGAFNPKDLIVVDAPKRENLSFTFD